ncbi:hypothetical protein LR48_Vigan10g104500 [Vigna angularis]|uniref:Uncharacterized protein n=1 Tax=Phaseolus angularis TaxID=3914 RepID=A0A0L9VJJ3_PHAAN|nr:hypothetical protein LR48_Vigan10g104500 [Vigna angularis]
MESFSAILIFVNNFGTDENQADPVAVKPRWNPKDGEQIKVVKLALHLSMEKGRESVHLRVSRNRKIVVYGERIKEFNGNHLTPSSQSRLLAQSEFLGKKGDKEEDDPLLEEDLPDEFKKTHFSF